ncbi:MAG: hypothetical protein KAH54_00655 [Candidatus Sabulitectum sp.]|nr:hypothetical protein [Candidatus Sabulitectum sp.]
MIIRGSLPEVPDRVYILGGGKFGSSAAVKVDRQWPGSHIHLVDTMSSLPSGIPGEHHTGTDAINFLQEHLEKGRPNDLVIPCIPVHMAFNWVLGHFGFCIPVPVRLMEFLPGAIAGKDRCIYTSLSDFLCPDSCAEPEGFCPTTEKKRKEPLFKIIERISLSSYRVIIVRSEQLLPGVGAVTSKQLFRLLAETRKKIGRSLIATASRCHGVVHGFIH